MQIRLITIFAVSLFSSMSLVARAQNQNIQQISLSSGSSLIEQLADGRLVQFNCQGSAAPVPTPSQATECSGTLTIQLPGYIGSQPTEQVTVVGDSANSKYEAIANLRANCVTALTNDQVSNAAGSCAGLVEGTDFTCKPL